MAWLRSLTWSHATWVAFQAWFVGVVVSDAATRQDPVPWFIRVPLAFVLGCLGCLALTVAWVLIYELFRYTLPRLIGRGLQKVRGRHSARLR